MAFDTLDEAQAEILRLNEELTAVKNERDTYSGKLTETAAELENVRKLNQTYFNKLNAQHNPNASDPDDNDEDDAPSCEEFANTITI